MISQDKCFLELLLHIILFFTYMFDYFIHEFAAHIMNNNEEKTILSGECRTKVVIFISKVVNIRLKSKVNYFE